LSRARCSSSSASQSWSMRTTVRRFSRSRIGVEKVSVRTDQRAFLRRRRSELVIFEVAFTRSGERATHPAPHAATPDAMHTSVRQNTLPCSSLFSRTRSLASLLPPCPGAYRCELAARRSRIASSRTASRRTTIACAISQTLEVGEALRMRRGVRPSHTPV
jgi:hypothetical protein